LSAEATMLEEIIAEAGGPDAFEAVLRSLPQEEVEQIAWNWALHSRPSQRPPPGNWRTWCVNAGRGFGKTRTGSEFVRAEVEAGRAPWVALVAPTAADARDVLVEGPAGLLAVSPPWFRPTYEPSKRRLSWPNGSVATLFSADEPERLRGPQHALAWLDEFAAYPAAEEVLAQVRLGLRLGVDPRLLITTTPRPRAAYRKLLADPTTVVTRGCTADNRANLPAAYLESIERQYAGTRTGRQELLGELLEDNPNALWKLDDIDAVRVARAPELRRVVVAVDPALSNNPDSDETGIIAAGAGICECLGKPELHGFVLADASGIMSPADWAKAVRRTFDRYQADRVIAETNAGGQLVELNLRANGASELPLKCIHATRGKALRAEPAAALYEQRKIHHVGVLGELENQMISWNPAEDSFSPDRVDALVYALVELLIQPLYEAPQFARYHLGPSRSAGLFDGRREGLPTSPLGRRHR
jgi:phage terminase large subunit-like protein